MGILPAAENLLDLVHHANHGIHPGVHIDALADRVLAVHKQLFRRVVPQNAHLGVTLIFPVGEEPALRQHQVRHDRHLRCMSFQNGAGHFVALVFCAHSAHKKRLRVLHPRIRGHHVRQISNRQRVIDREFLPRQLLGSHLLHPERKVIYPEHIGAQRIRKIAYPVVQPVDDRRDRDHRSDTDDDAQDGEPGAQLVGPQRIECHLDGFANLTLRHKTPSFQLSVVSYQRLDQSNLFPDRFQETVSHLSHFVRQALRLIDELGIPKFKCARDFELCLQFEI